MRTSTTYWVQGSQPPPQLPFGRDESKASGGVGRLYSSKGGGSVLMGGSWHGDVGDGLTRKGALYVTGKGKYIWLSSVGPKLGSGGKKEASYQFILTLWGWLLPMCGFPAQNLGAPVWCLPRSKAAATRAHHSTAQPQGSSSSRQLREVSGIRPRAGLLETDVIPTMQTKPRPTVSWQSPCSLKAGSLLFVLGQDTLWTVLLEIRKTLNFSTLLTCVCRLLLLGGETAACLGLWVPGSSHSAGKVEREGAASVPNLLAILLLPGEGFSMGSCLSLSQKKLERLTCTSGVFQGDRASVISHSREGPKPPQFCLILSPDVHLGGRAGQAKPLGQDSQVLMYFKVVCHLRWDQGLRAGPKVVKRAVMELQHLNQELLVLGFSHPVPAVALLRPGGFWPALVLTSFLVLLHLDLQIHIVLQRLLLPFCHRNEAWEDTGKLFYGFKYGILDLVHLFLVEGFHLLPSYVLEGCQQVQTVLSCLKTGIVNMSKDIFTTDLEMAGQHQCSFSCPSACSGLFFQLLEFSVLVFTVSLHCSRDCLFLGLPDLERNPAHGPKTGPAARILSCNLVLSPTLF